MEIQETSCCGMRELSGIYQDRHNWNRLLQDVAEDFWPNDDYYAMGPEDGRENWSVAIFTDAESQGNGEKLAAFIKEGKWGALTKSRWHLNPNSDNMIAVWVWNVNRKKLHKWFKCKRD